MKKNVLYMFSLILYLLIICTMLSKKIETEMYTQVEVSYRSYTGHIGEPFSSSTDVLFEDEEGLHLYELAECSGWYDGYCIQELPSTLWYFDDNTGKIKLPNGRNYILVESASRFPKEGSAVVVVDIPKRTINYVPFTDKYLVYYPDGVPKKFILPENSKIIEQSDTAVLLDMEDITYPFFEHTARQLSVSMSDENCRVFSLTEAEVFLKQLPLLAVIAIFLVLPVLIWMCSGVLVRQANRYRRLLITNIGFVAISILGAIGILRKIDFPASFMPDSSIFDFSHYMREFAFITNAQSSLEGSGQTIALLIEEIKNESAIVLGIGGFACMVVIVFEIVMARITITHVEKRKHVA